MSISVYRLQQVSDPDLDIGRQEGWVLANHWPRCSDENTDYIYISEDELQMTLEEAAECDGTCDCFEAYDDQPNKKQAHDEAVVNLGVVLPKMLANARAEGNNGYTTLQINW